MQILLCWSMREKNICQPCSDMPGTSLFYWFLRQMSLDGLPCTRRLYYLEINLEWMVWSKTLFSRNGWKSTPPSANWALAVWLSWRRLKCQVSGTSKSCFNMKKDLKDPLKYCWCTIFNPTWAVRRPLGIVRKGGSSRLFQMGLLGRGRGQALESEHKKQGERKGV